MRLKNSICYFLLGMAILSLSSFFKINSGYIIKLPKHFQLINKGAPIQFIKIDQHKMALGRKLFYDPGLSLDSTISCSSCHLQYAAFTHVDHNLSHGIQGKIGTRNAPALMNLYWSKHFMWDGAESNLAHQAILPITNPVEMAENIEHILLKLSQNSRYDSLKELAYPKRKWDKSLLLDALQAFEFAFISCNSKYDSVKAKVGKVAFTAQEQRGYQLYLKNCSQCHKEPLFSGNEFADNGLAIDTGLNDFGRVVITNAPVDSYAFKIPTLRNLEFSYPYMHDGRFKKLSQVLVHYTKGMVHRTSLSPALKNPIILSDRDKADLIAFLLTLSDYNYVFNKNLSYPNY